ncbi:MAG TPA: hypothetical protein VE818_00615 [Nitrososphaeraceae archaeon]|nr:hypothetical protein [Nitrososphaeraceae archaeon]
MYNFSSLHSILLPKVEAQTADKQLEDITSAMPNGDTQINLLADIINATENNMIFKV